MPCSSCTTGSPTRTSEEVLEHAVDIGRLGPFAPRLAVLLGYSSVSVTSEIFSSTSAAHGERRCGDAERCRRCVKRFAKSSTFVASNPCSVNISASVCNRPALSAQSSTRPLACVALARKSANGPSGRSLRRSTSSGGTPRAASLAPALSSARIPLQCMQKVVATKIELTGPATASHCRRAAATSDRAFPSRSRSAWRGRRPARRTPNVPGHDRRASLRRQRIAAGRTRCRPERCRWRRPCRPPTSMGRPQTFHGIAGGTVCARFVRRKLAGGEQRQIVDRVQRALRIRLERLIDSISSSNRSKAYRRAAGWEDVDDAAAHGELALRDHFASRGCSHPMSSVAAASRRQGAVLLQRERSGGDVAAWRRAFGVAVVAATSIPSQALFARA